MLFNSIAFLIFFPIVTILYFLLPHKFRWLLLLLASCYFYMYFVPVYILILFFTIIIDYIAGICIENAKEPKQRKVYLVISLIANIGVLCFFKYFNFLNDNLSLLLGGLGRQNPIPYLQILLPIGLSFHTFQAMSYTIEIYRGNFKAERHFGIYALYVMFYPQLVAGPIERPQNVLPQFHKVQRFNYANLVSGLKQMAWGMFKKVVIADRLSILVNTVNDDVYAQNGFGLLLAAYFFAFQIYCDFSGYSDIALGAARVMGINLMKNFDRPYVSQSISEFWKRWHISLSTWFRDYLYIPMGGNRTSSKWKHYWNLFVTFLVSGIWHGANWTYVIWGALHGFYLVFALVTRPFRNRLVQMAGLKKGSWFYRFVNMMVTFHLVLIGWVFFRANTVNEAFYSLREIINFSGYRYSLEGLGLNWMEIIVAISSIFGLLILEYIHSKYNLSSVIGTKPLPIKWLVYCLFIIIIVLFGEYKGQQFIYFQF
ncbi:membrane-bound O-acyltransferase family protein [Chitinophaga alhagiae]|uniref:Membrane-bound O-acyltransferase family protein n=1 Tax=Chitinophaga alhagiae TaxID=2203219 RepID=A0ABM6WAW4_9BACT|nr:MBOAT family O-acyltransferase [Chitinophaga alhagiae]AWO01174.1 membrane-bound O-acyltransferase family protein [Chitinophaga alhagiae]